LAAWNTLYICLDYGLKLMHPTMPYVTEELYQRLPHDKNNMAESIVIAQFPTSVLTFENEGIEQ